jgi:hypothetical protein
MNLEGMRGEATIEDVLQENDRFFLGTLWLEIDVSPQYTRSTTKVIGIKTEDQTYDPNDLLIRFTVDQQVSRLEVYLSKFELSMPCRDSIRPTYVEREGDLRAYNHGELPAVGRDIRAVKRIINNVRETFWFRLKYELPTCYEVTDSVWVNLGGFVADGEAVGPHVVAISKAPHYEVRQD